MKLNIPDIPKLIMYMGVAILVLSAGWVLILLIASFGCVVDVSQIAHDAAKAAVDGAADRLGVVDARQLAYDAARAAVDGAADRLGVPEPTDAVTPIQGLFGAAGVMVAYLIRKRFWPMGKR